MGQQRRYRSAGLDGVGRASPVPSPGPSIRTRLRVSGLVLAFVVAAAMGATGCGGGAASTQTSPGAEGSPASGTGGQDKPTLTIGLNADFASLNPAKDAGAFSAIPMALTNAPLVHLKRDGSFSAGGPALTTSYRYVGSGNDTFELTLRRNARFSDGSPVDAAAVKKWLTYFPTENGPVSSQMQIESIETKGRWKVVLHLASPNPNVPWLLSETPKWGAVSSPKALENPEVLGTKTIGAGPYTLDPARSATGNQYTLVPNEHYWDQDAIRFREVIVKIITNPSSMLQAVKAGQVDVAIGDATTASAAEESGASVVWKPRSWDGLVLMDWQGKKVPALGDVRVRQALNYAIDREAVTEGLLGEYGAPTSAVFTRDGFDESLQNHYPYDPEKARSLLAEAGYPDGFSLAVASDASSGVLGDPVAQAVAKYLQEVGVNVKVSSLSPTALYVQKGFTEQFPAVQTQGAAAPMTTLYGQVFLPESLANPFHLTDPTLDDLFAEGVKADDAETYWREMTHRMTTQAYFIPVFLAPAIFYVSPDIGGVDWSARSVIPSATDWYPKEG